MNDQQPPPISPSDVYSAITARRLQWDNLVWQVPLLSLTAQAFLLTLALGPDTSRLGRIIAVVLSAGITLLCVTLMRRHRQAEITDAHWLQRREKGLKKPYIVHGRAFQKDRKKTEETEKKSLGPLPDWRGYKAWAIGLSLFWIVDILIVVVTFLRPEWLGPYIPSTPNTVPSPSIT